MTNLTVERTTSKKSKTKAKVVPKELFIPISTMEVIQEGNKTIKKFIPIDSQLFQSQLVDRDKLFGEYQEEQVESFVNEDGIAISQQELITAIKKVLRSPKKSKIVQGHISLPDTPYYFDFMEVNNFIRKLNKFF